MQGEFPNEIGTIQLNLLSPFGFKHHFGSMKPAKKRFVTFDFVSVVQSCELVRFCLEDQPFYKREENRFRWLEEGLFFLKWALSNIHDDQFYRDVQNCAKISIREHPLCAAWKLKDQFRVRNGKNRRRNNG